MNLDAALTPIAFDAGDTGISQEKLSELVGQLAEIWVDEQGVKRVLLLPPDHTRLHSFAGEITALLWKRLHQLVDVDILPALGTHKPMREHQLRMMFGDEIPVERFIPHDWENDLEPLGTLSREVLSELSGGKINAEVEVAVNQRIVSGQYDLVLSIGQVVPHEVIGFANHSKNICIGCGGGEMLHYSHFLGAVHGIERTLGEIDTPVRQLVDDGFYRFVQPKADVRFVLTVVEDTVAGPRLRALTAGADSECFRWAAGVSRRCNVTVVEKPISRCVVYLDPNEFSSTWLGNKAIYRTRKAMADGGELLVLAPAVDTFGEAERIDQLIRQYGYLGTEKTLAALESDELLAENLSAAAHLIHGSTEGRFNVTYCTGEGLSADEVKAVGYHHRPYDQVAEDFGIEKLSDGWHDGPDGEPFYFIRNPALGLWTYDG